MTDIFRYTDYRLFLRDWFDDENARRVKAGRAPLSHRKLAELAGASSSATLAQILSRRRRLTDALAQKLRVALTLEEAQYAWLSLMMQRERAEQTRERAREALRKATEASDQTQDARAKSRTLRRAQVCRKALSDAEVELQRVDQAMTAARVQRQVEVMDAERLRLVSHWRTLAVLELARREDFRSDPEWIAAALRGAASAEQVAHTLSALEALGHRLGGDQPLPGPLRTPEQVPASVVRDYYFSLLERVNRAVADHFDPEQAAFQARSRLGAITVAMPVEGLPRLHEAFARAQAELLTLAESLPGRRDLVVQVYLHLFPLSEPPREPDAGGTTAGCSEYPTLKRSP